MLSNFQQEPGVVSLRSLLDPFLIPDMAKAAERLWQARERGESVTIFGDYDVDGVTASAILLEVLGYQLVYLLPQQGHLVPSLPLFVDPILLVLSSTARAHYLKRPVWDKVGGGGGRQEKGR